MLEEGPHLLPNLVFAFCSRSRLGLMSQCLLQIFGRSDRFPLRIDKLEGEVPEEPKEGREKC